MAEFSLAGSNQNTTPQYMAQPINGSNFLKPQTYNTNIGLAGNTGNYNYKPPEDFDFNNALSNFALGAQGITGLAGAYNAYQQQKLLEEQLGIQKSALNRNVANTAATTNRQLDDRASMAAQLTTGADYGTPEYEAAKAKLITQVDGSPVA